MYNTQNSRIIHYGGDSHKPDDAENCQRYGTQNHVR